MASETPSPRHPVPPGHGRRRLRVASNVPGLERTVADGLDLEVSVLEPTPRGWRNRMAACRRALDGDYVVVNCSPVDLFDYCTAKLLFPGSRGRVVSLDTVLPVPHANSVAARAKLGVKKFLFRQVSLFLEYFRETDGYERHYGIPHDRFRYVPFKINRYERVLSTPTRDDGYIFCGGSTRRDFTTLIAAVRDLDWPVRIVTMSNEVIASHGSVLDERDLPAHVQVVRHDGSDSFLDHIAGARMVALPIVRENISASGIGVYLASMALGKCVVTSAGPAVNGVLPPDAALVVPPEDAAALRAAITRAWTDDALRQRVAAAGQRYALGLGGEDRLAQSVMNVLVADYSTSA